MGCGAVQRDAARRPADPELDVEADLTGLSSRQIQALASSSSTPAAVTSQIKRIRLGDSVRVRLDLTAVEVQDVEGASVQDSPRSLPFSDSLLSVGSSSDFDALGWQLLAGAEEAASPSSEEYHEVDAIWEHPNTGARLLVGCERLATSRELVEAHRVSCVVRCLDLDGTRGAFEGEAGFEYLHFPIAWWNKTGHQRTDKGVARILAPLLGFVAESLSNGKTVLVHCLAGAHRAGTSGVACLMHLCHLDAASAICAAQAARPCIQPISHLRVLLRRLERARRNGVVEPAIKVAASKGFQKTAQDVFGSLA